nr:sialin-like [Penaeus vannamei]
MAAVCASVGLGGSAYCGFMCSHQDLAPNLAGSLMGLSLSVGTVPGFLAPLLSGLVLSGDQTLAGWRTIFVVSACMSLVTGAIYVAFVTAEQQSWKDTRSEAQKHGKNTLPGETVHIREETGPSGEPEGQLVASFTSTHSGDQDPDCVTTHI